MPASAGHLDQLLHPRGHDLGVHGASEILDASRLGDGCHGGDIFRCLGGFCSFGHLDQASHAWQRGGCDQDKRAAPTTSARGTPAAAANLAQSSYSGEAATTSPPRTLILTRTVPQGVSTVRT